jgi:hypothetical protein
MSTSDRDKVLEDERQERNIVRFVAAVALVLFLSLAYGFYTGDIKFHMGGGYVDENYEPVERN